METTKYPFDEKVKSMSQYEIVMAMVNGLINPKVNVKMSTYGSASDSGVCFGCAATNAICEISGKVFTPAVIRTEDDRASYVHASFGFIHSFELAIDSLRSGAIVAYNRDASKIGIALLPYPESKPLPPMTDGTYERCLQAYIDYAETQCSRERPKQQTEG